VFLNEVLAAVRSAAPALFLRLSAFEGVPDGLDQVATLALARRLRLELVDVVDVSAGCYEAGEWMVQPGEVPRGVLASAASAFRALGKPVCVAGRIPPAMRRRTSCAPVPPTSSPSAGLFMPTPDGRRRCCAVLSRGRASAAIRAASTSCTPNGRSGAW
jgi:hypothetical protein